MFKRMTTPFSRTALASTMVLALALGSATGGRRVAEVRLFARSDQ